MKLVVGLGNPGKQYEGTRHNAGFRFVDKLAEELGVEMGTGEMGTFLPKEKRPHFTNHDKFKSEVLEIIHKGEKIILAKPQTFMNLSGKAVSMIMSYYNIVGDDLIVVSDDVDLPVGQARIRHDGSSGGQKGLQNIIDTLKTDEFVRIRIGIGSGTEEANEIETADFVLSKFSDKENEIIDETIELVIGRILPFIEKNEKIPAHTISLNHE